jgi:tetratricopeptide (TPR) repeat protein
MSQSHLPVGFAAACLLNAGRNADAGALLTAGAASSVPLRRLLAVAYARQGKVDEAARIFLELAAQPDLDEETRRTAVLLLRKVAVRGIRRADWAAGAEALGAALRLAPGDPDVRSLVSSVENVMPIAFIKAGKRAEAAAAWEKIQRDAPANARTAHSLALLYRFWVEDLEGRSVRETADGLWPLLLGNWVVTLFSDGFWTEWSAARRSIYPVPPEAVEKARERWSEDLMEYLSTRSAARDSAGDAVGAARFRRLGERYWVERTTAMALYELRKVSCPACRQMTAGVETAPGQWVCADPRCAKPLPSPPAHAVPVCGPAMLKHWGAEAAAQALAKRASTLPNGAALTGALAALGLPLVKTNAEALAICLSEFALPFALLARREFAAVLSTLGKVRGRDPLEQRILLYASLERGNQLVASGGELPKKPDAKATNAYMAPRREAMTVWSAALPSGTADSALADRIGERIEAVFVGAANELNGEAEGAGNRKEYPDEFRLLGAAIDVLTEAHKVTKRPRIASTLSALHVERGLSHRRAEDSAASLDRAIADFEKALEVLPGDEGARKKLAGALNTKAVKADGAVALRHYNRAIELDPQNGLYWRNRGIEHLNASHRDDAISDLEKAMRLGSDCGAELAGALNGKAVAMMNGYNPGFFEKQQARELLLRAVRLAPGNATFRNNLLQVM